METQSTIFDISPADNMDIVDQLNGFIQRLEAAKPWFDGKAPKLAAGYIGQIDGIIAGIQETITTGKGLNDLIDDKTLDGFLSKFKRSADRMMSEEEAKAIDVRIETNRQARLAKLESEGDLAKPFNSLVDVVGIQVDVRYKALFLLGVDQDDLLAQFESIRQQLNSIGVYDSSQLHLARLSKVKNWGEHTGALESLVRNFIGYLKDDKRSKPKNRLNRIANYSNLFGIDFSMLHPDRISETRKLVNDSGLIKINPELFT